MLNYQILKMPQYLPFAGRNSVAEALFGVQFALPFDQRIGSFSNALKEAFAAELTKFEPMQTYTFNLGTQLPQGVAPNIPPTITGFNLSKLKPDGSPARVLRAMNNALTIHFLEYNSWNETKPVGLQFLKRCIEILNLIDTNPVVSVALRYIDRFTFDGIPEEATALALFKRDTQFITPRVMAASHLWHSNSGWYEPLIGDAKALNQLNVTSGMTGQAFGVTVDHNSLFNLPEPYTSVGEIFQGTGNKIPLEQILDRQHHANTDLLKNLLSQEMLNTIGLNG